MSEGQDSEGRKTRRLGIRRVDIQKIKIHQYMWIEISECRVRRKHLVTRFVMRQCQYLLFNILNPEFWITG